MDNNTNPMPNPMPNPAPEPTPEPTPNPDQASNPAPEAAPAMPAPEAAPAMPAPEAAPAMPAPEAAPAMPAPEATPAMNNPEPMSAPAGAPIAPVAAPAIPNNMNMPSPAPNMPNGNQNNQAAPANGEKKKSNKGVIIGLCVGLGVIVIALVVTLIIVINNNNASKAVSNNGGNHYEKPDEDDGDDDGDDDGGDDDEDTVACMGFKFNQVKGYEYKCVSGDPSGLVASSDTHQVELQLINDTYANLRANVQNLALQLSGSFQIDRYGTWNSKDGDEMIIFRVAAENITAYLFLAKANSTSTFFGSVQNSTGIAAESDLETALKIIDESDSPASRLNADLLKDQITGDGTVKNLPTTFPSSN